MTDYTNLLAELASPFDIESLRTKCLVERGIDIQGVYDLHTGRIIGYLEADELEFAIEEIDYDSDDELLDQLIERVIGAMRPSICLNRPDRVTIQNLLIKRPVDCLAFLVNRLHANRKTLIERGRDTTAFLHDRIILYKRLCTLDDLGIDLTPWTHWLLELDSKLNLHDTPCPLFAFDRLNRPLRVLRDGTSIFWLLDESNHQDLLKVFESWVFELLAKYEARDTQLRKESEWFRGNTHTQPAFVRSWMENPQIANRKEAARVKKERAAAKAKPGRPMSEKTKAKHESIQTALAQLEAILQSGQQPDRPKDTTPKPVVLKPVLANLLRNLKKELAA